MWPIPVHFVYLGSDGRENRDRQFDAISVSVPRSGSQKVIVHNVYHKFILTDEEELMQVITVVLKEFPAE